MSPKIWSLAARYPQRLEDDRPNACVAGFTDDGSYRRKVLTLEDVFGWWGITAWAALGFHPSEQSGRFDDGWEKVQT